MRRRAGFTLIELLVVIAIIGILAAMLFPVFARARESARKVQCLANVKNIAIAINMYLTDYDRMPPTEHRQDVADWLANDWGVCSTKCDRYLKCRGTAANPYLRVPVILDDYIKNRDIWRCPSAYFQPTITINPTINGDWLAYMKQNNATQNSPCPNPRPCTNVFPPGWGGAVTDTIAQVWSGCGNAGEPGVFVQSYGFPSTARDISTSAMDDSARFVVVGEAGKNLEGDRTSQFAYPDMCRIDQVACNDTCGADWTNCAWSRECGPEAIEHGGTPTPASDVQYRKEHYHARHLGGENLGFADGHAKWYPAEAILFGGSNSSGYANGSDILQGLQVCFNPTATKK